MPVSFLGAVHHRMLDRGVSATAPHLVARPAAMRQNMLGEIRERIHLQNLKMVVQIGAV